MVQKVIKMYYDSFEFKYGDGFYPIPYKINGYDSEIDILFQYYDHELTQLSGPLIKGYDGFYSEIVKLILV
jgi:hypothetical protein